MSARKEDVLKGLRLLEEYRVRLEGTGELALQGTLSNAIAAIRSSLFTALLDIHDVYGTSLELSKAVRLTDRGDPPVSPSSNNTRNISAHSTTVFNGVHEPTTDQKVLEEGTAVPTVETKTSCEPDTDMLARCSYVTDRTPSTGGVVIVTEESILSIQTNGTIGHEGERANAEIVTPTPPMGATEAVSDEQRYLDELKSSSIGDQDATDELKTVSVGEQKTVSMDELKTVSMDKQKTVSMDEQKTVSMDEQKTVSMDEQKPTTIDEHKPESISEQLTEWRCDEQSNDQKTLCVGEQSPACSEHTPACVVKQERDEQRHLRVTEEQKPTYNCEHKSAPADVQAHVCNGNQKPLSAEEQKMLKAATKRFNIAKEFMDTEAKYVDRLRIISDFLGIVRDFDVENKHMIPELTNRLMFQHVKEMYELNSSLLKQLQHCVDTWKTEERLGVILREYVPKLKVYCLYAAGYEDAIMAITHWSARDKKFDILVKEFDEKMGDGSGGGFITRCMLEPVLRILRYRLLLTEYIKYGVKGSSELENSEAAQTVISEAASESNSRIEELKNCNEILAIQRSLNGTKSLLVPGRSFIKKGELLKQSRKTSYTRMFFLFSDILLHTDLCIGLSQSFKIKDELSVWGMKVEEPLVPPLPHCFIVTSVKRSLILSASSEVEKQDWMKAFRRAIDAHQKIANTLKTLPTLTGDFGSCAPIMVPDKNVTMCQLCAELFTTTFRRHHCRACGKVVCGNCSQKKAYLAYNSKYERVCEVCYVSASRRRANSYTTVITSDPQKEDLRDVCDSTLLDNSDVLHTKGFDTSAAVAGYVWIMDKKRSVKMWYHVKKDFVLYKFKAHEDVKAVGTVPLPGFIVKSDLETATISLVHESIKKEFVVHESFKLENPADLDKWITVLCKATQLQVVPPIPLQ